MEVAMVTQAVWACCNRQQLYRLDLAWKMWGHSPALDLLKEYKRIRVLPQEGELRILLVGSIDSRHVLQTMAHWKRHGTCVRLIFYILDLALELVARQMLLLTIALEPPDKLGLHEKARLWMEIYGNTLLRPTTARYLIDKAWQMVRMVTDREFLEGRMPCLELDLLRYMEKDHLENIFKYWICNRYSLAKIWDRKIRKELGTRYDSKMGVFDWDYNMKLLEIQDGNRVCLPEYRHWRSTGIGFTWLETEYSVTNPTLACGVGVYGDQLFSHGYVGDTTSGPFYAFGTQSEETKMLETSNGYNHRRATDITERNLQRLFVELETGAAPTDLYAADIDMGLVITNPPKVDLDAETALNYEPDKTPESYSAVHTDHKVVFMPVNALQTFTTKPKYQEFFDMAYVGEKYFKFVSKDLLAMVKPNSPLVIETRKFVIFYDKKIGEFEREVKDKMKELGGKEISKCHYRRHSYALYKVNIVGKEDEEEDTCSVVEECDATSQKASSSGSESEDDELMIDYNENVEETSMEEDVSGRELQLWTKGSSKENTDTLNQCLVQHQSRLKEDTFCPHTIQCDSERKSTDQENRCQIELKGTSTEEQDIQSHIFQGFLETLTEEQGTYSSNQLVLEKDPYCPDTNQCDSERTSAEQEHRCKNQLELKGTSTEEQDIQSHISQGFQETPTEEQATSSSNQLGLEKDPYCPDKNQCDSKRTSAEQKNLWQNQRVFHGTPTEEPGVQSHISQGFQETPTEELRTSSSNQLGLEEDSYRSGTIQCDSKRTSTEEPGSHRPIQPGLQEESNN